MIPGNCVRALPHRFDTESGWCVNGCGWRQDGHSQYRFRSAWNRCTPAVDITEPRRGAQAVRNG